MQKEKKWKNLSNFQKVSIIMSIIFIIVIIIQCGFLINLKLKYDEIKKKNDKITSQLPNDETSQESNTLFDVDLTIINLIK